MHLVKIACERPDQVGRSLCQWRQFPVQLFQERDELDLPLPLGGAAVDPARAGVGRGEQVQRALAFVLVFHAHRQRAGGPDGRTPVGRRTSTQVVALVPGFGLGAVLDLESGRLHVPGPAPCLMPGLDRKQA